LPAKDSVPRRERTFHTSRSPGQSSGGPLSKGYYASSQSGEKDVTGSTSGTTLLTSLYSTVFQTWLANPNKSGYTVLVDSKGNYVSQSYFQSYKNFSSFLSGATTNPASNLLSAQLVATELNVYLGRLNPQEYIYTPNVSGMTPSYQQSLAANGIWNFVQIQTLINKTISELEIAPNPASGSAAATYETALEICFDSINNNKQIFVI
jgi:hypothetical protein